MRIMNYKIILKEKKLFDSHYENSTEIVYELDENGIITLLSKTGKLF
jgi:FKBP-type peptidyl-prolyl cis-trans isomerase 2